jgi:hypothetical protein
MRVNSRGSFATDLGVAIRVWARHPFLPLLSLGVWAGPSLLPSKPPWDVISVVPYILLVGYPGTEREWYRRAFAGRAFRPRELVSSVAHHFGPFLRLAAMVLLPFALLFALPPAIGLRIWIDRTAFFVGMFVFFLFVDLALTFVVPALTFTTRKVSDAARIGFAMIRDDWPRSGWYALTPPLALLLLVRAPLLSREIGSAVRWVLPVVATLLALAFKGAIARHYLRLDESRTWPSNATSLI